MEYEKFMKGAGFEMFRSGNTISIHPWDSIICEMVYSNLLTIWRPVKGSEIKHEGLITHSTPKLRRLMRREVRTN